jgi:hypothetical protein
MAENWTDSRMIKTVTAPKHTGVFSTFVLCYRSEALPDMFIILVFPFLALNSLRNSDMSTRCFKNDYVGHFHNPASIFIIHRTLALLNEIHTLIFLLF